MRKRVQVALAVSLAALVGVAVWQGLREREPYYQGRSLRAWTKELQASSWVAEFHASWMPNGDSNKRPLSAEAIRQIGTNAVPLLVEMVRAKDSPVKRLMTNIARRQKLLRVRWETDWERRQMAADGFLALGPLGEDAVPALVGLLDDQDNEVRLTAAECLGNIGASAKAAVPRLLTFLSERDTDLSDSATRNLGKIQPDLIVRRLIKQLDASGGPVMLQAGIISALGEFGSNAKAAIPLIIPFLNAADADTRTAATNALNAIDAVAAAKAGAK